MSRKMLNGDKFPKKCETPVLDTIEGSSFFECLANGFTIICKRWDGWLWHFLLEQTDKKKYQVPEAWKWMYFAAYDLKKPNHVVNMCTYRNMRRAEAIKRFRKEFFEDMISKENLYKKS